MSKMLWSLLKQRVNGKNPSKRCQFHRLKLFDGLVLVVIAVLAFRMYQTALPDYSRRVQQLAFTESPVIVLAQACREGSDLHFVVQESWRNRTGRPLPVPIGRVIPQLSMPAGSADDIDGAIVFFRRQNESTVFYRHLAIFTRNGRTNLAIPLDWLDYLTLGYRQHTTARIKNYVLSLLPASTP